MISNKSSVFVQLSSILSWSEIQLVLQRLRSAAAQFQDRLCQYWWRIPTMCYVLWVTVHSIPSSATRKPVRLLWFTLSYSSVGNRLWSVMSHCYWCNPSSLISACTHRRAVWRAKGHIWDAAYRPIRVPQQQHPTCLCDIRPTNRHLLKSQEATLCQRDIIRCWSPWFFPQLCWLSHFYSWLECVH